MTAGAPLPAGVAAGTLHSLGKPVLSPLWFPLVFAALTAAAPLVARRLGWINVAAGWLVPYCLGGIPPLRTAAACRKWQVRRCGGGPDGPVDHGVRGGT